MDDNYAYVVAGTPAEYDGTITEIYIDPYTGDSFYAAFGAMKLKSAPVGGTWEQFGQGAGGDYDGDIEVSAGSCNHLVAGVDYTVFSCDAGEYAGVYINGGDVEAKTGQSGNTYRYGYSVTYDGQLEEDGSYERLSGYELQMYFVNTL